MVAYENDGKIKYIVKTLLMLSTCFQYGLEKELKKNGGRVVYLKTTEIKECSIAKELQVHRAEWDTKNINYDKEE